MEIFLLLRNFEFHYFVSDRYLVQINLLNDLKLTRANSFNLKKFNMIIFLS